MWSERRPVPAGTGAPDHPDLATDLYYYAGLLLLVEKYEEAEALLLESLDIRRQVYDGPHRTIADNYATLGRAKVAQADLPAAFDYINRGLEMRRETLGAGHSEVADSLADLADAYEAEGDLASAERHLRDSIAIYEAALGEEHPRTIKAHRQLDKLLQSGGAADQ